MSVIEASPTSMTIPREIEPSSAPDDAPGAAPVAKRAGATPRSRTPMDDDYMMYTYKVCNLQ